jgi:hypothetical protein
MFLAICAGVFSLGLETPAGAETGIALPTYQAGTTFIYSNGSWETVEAVRGNQITWRNHRDRVSVGTRDFSYRRQQWESGKRQGTRQQRPRRDWFSRSAPASLWPLSEGNEARYVETGRWQDEEGRWRTYKAQWRSKVAGRERVRTLAGEFDTWKIVAYRYSEGSAYGRPPKLRDVRTWYYAPEVGHYVRYIKEYRGRKPTRRVDLVSVRPPIDHLGASVSQAIDQNFQLALEKKRSGQKLRWQLPRQSASGMTQPIATFRAAKNRFCRHYVQTVTIGQSDRTYFGMACRDAGGRWRIPRL